MAIDLAARELFAFENFSVNAGGDLYLGGLNPHGRSWRVGIRHPRVDRTLIDAVSVSNRAVCTSGDYERGNHILDPRSGGSANLAASVTVIASTAMLADALATAAFVLGPQQGLELLKRVGVDGLIVSQTLDEHATEGMSSDYRLGSSAIL